MSDSAHEEDNIPEETIESPPEKKVPLCRRILKFLGSNAGTFLVLVAYTVAGAYGFIYFESGLEEEER